MTMVQSVQKSEMMDIDGVLEFNMFESLTPCIISISILKLKDLLLFYAPEGRQQFLLGQLARRQRAFFHLEIINTD